MHERCQTSMGRNIRYCKWADLSIVVETRCALRSTEHFAETIVSGDIHEPLHRDVHGRGIHVHIRFRIATNPRQFMSSRTISNFANPR